jgi:hypothetical protein
MHERKLHKNHTRDVRSCIRWRHIVLFFKHAPSLDIGANYHHNPMEISVTKGINIAKKDY